MCILDRSSLIEILNPYLGHMRETKISLFIYLTFDELTRYKYIYMTEVILIRLRFDILSNRSHMYSSFTGGLHNK